MYRTLGWGFLVSALWAVFCSAAEKPRWFPYHSFSRNLETVKAFGQMGVNVVTIFPANNLCSLGVPYSPYPPVWLGPGRYDFDCLDRQVADVLAVHPNARLICEVDLNTPPWWPRWLQGAQQRDDSFLNLGKIAASEEWRKDTRAYLQAFLRHTESRHRARIVAYVLFAGMTLEWQDWSRGWESVSKRAAWRRWMTDSGHPDPVDIPPASVREHVSHDIFRDPVADAQAINYWRFHHRLVGDTILFFAGATQEIIEHRVPVGVYYGYVMEHSKGRLLYEGHLDFDRVFASPDVDFFAAPGSYRDRQIGGASGFMQCLGSIRHHGKGFIHESDHRTHTARSVTLLGLPVPGHKAGFPDEQATIAGLRREFALALVNGTSLSWFDMFGHWYDGQRVMGALRQMRELWDRLAKRDVEPAAEVAVLVDAESMFYVDGQAPLYPELLNRQRHGLGRMGTPYEVFSLADLPTLDLSPYKLILLPNLFVVDQKKRDLLHQKVCTGGKTVLWIYAPGIIADGKFDPAGVQRLTGVPFGTKELTPRAMDGWKSVFSPMPNVPAATLRRIAQDAGVHLYCLRLSLTAGHTPEMIRRLVEALGKCEIRMTKSE